MALDVEWSSRAKRDLKKVPANVHDVIVHAVNRLAETGEGDVVTLRTGKDKERRLRVRDWRVRFRVVESTMIVLRVVNRRDTFKKTGRVRHGTEDGEVAHLEESVED